MRVWAEDLPSLFAEAARGMNSLAGARLAPSPRVRREYKARGPDAESLLVAFLTELVYAQEQENLGFDRVQVHVSDHQISASLEGAPLELLAKAIKAVTYHNLKIGKTERGYEVEIVFDV
jgi:SHS2 domain-containing protein